MSSIKKTFIIILTVIVVSGIAFNLTDRFGLNESNILYEIDFYAVYLKNEGVVKISFEDKSNNTEYAILEILGMDVTYQQEYFFDGESSFIEKMNLKKIPKYGWQTTPVTLEIQHNKFGKIGLKTEIHEPDQPRPKIIVEEK